MTADYGARHDLLHERARSCLWHRRESNWCWCHWRNELAKFHERHGCGPSHNDGSAP